jgi:hypothetical protein
MSRSLRFLLSPQILVLGISLTGDYSSRASIDQIDPELSVSTPIRITAAMFKFRRYRYCDTVSPIPQGLRYLYARLVVH